MYNPWNSGDQLSYTEPEINRNAILATKMVVIRYENIGSRSSGKYLLSANLKFL